MKRYIVTLSVRSEVGAEPHPDVIKDVFHRVLVNQDPVFTAHGLDVRMESTHIETDNLNDLVPR